MNSYDIRITRLYTAGTANGPESDIPNVELGGPPSEQFYLVLEAEAGSVVANCGAPYFLKIIAFNDDLGKPEEGLLPQGENPREETFDAAGGWDQTTTPVPGLTKRTAYLIKIPALIPRDCDFHYRATLMTPNYANVSRAQSKEFTIV